MAVGMKRLDVDLHVVKRSKTKKKKKKINGSFKQVLKSSSAKIYSKVLHFFLFFFSLWLRPRLPAPPSASPPDPLQLYTLRLSRPVRGEAR